MIVLLRIARAAITALIFVVTGGGFLFNEAARGLAHLQKYLTREIERRRS